MISDDGHYYRYIYCAEYNVMAYRHISFDHHVVLCFSFSLPKLTIQKEVSQVAKADEDLKAEVNTCCVLGR